MKKREDEEIESEEESKAPFNMALDTLKSLREILREIKQLSYKVQFSPEIQQEIKISLVKQFFINASPLLPSTEKKKYRKIIIPLKSVYGRIKKRRGFHEADKTKLVNVYSEKLDNKLDEILIDLQTILQKEKYFMPPAEDEGDY